MAEEEEDTASVVDQENNSEASYVKPSALQQQLKQQLSADTYYKHEDLSSTPFVTPGSEIPGNLLHLSHSFGYDSRRRANLQLLDDRTLIFIAGNVLVLLDVFTAEQKYLRSCSGAGIGSITVHPSREFFVAAEKGNQPNILVYEYPSLRLYRILRGGAAQAYSSVQFNHDGSLLASVGGAPDYMLTLWNWRQEEVVLRSKAISQEVYRVSFSPYDPGLLTSSGSGHIKFWKIASTFTGLKLQGHVGHFGITAATDIDGYVELPDGKVVSGTEWGNLLLWDGNAIKVEISRKDGRSCHAGTVQPFVLDDGQLMTVGSDGVVRAWDFESIHVADGYGDSGRFEMEPMNEMVVGHNVCLTSVVRSPQTDSFIWFAQDSNGAIWKLDLSFTNTTPDPECVFSFHAGAIEALDVSQISHLMATTAPDRSVRVFDFLAKTELTTSRFNQGGTALIWAPPLVSQRGGLLVAGFEDGVVRLLELYSAQRRHVLSGRNPRGDARLRLLQAFKPHTSAVTALAFDRNGDILASGSSDCSVFFFAVGETYSPIGFVRVPGPVRQLQWSPHSHSESRLLILCQSGHVVEVHSPEPKAQKSTKTFQLLDLPRRSFRFRSIKSRIQREEEITRRKEVKQKKKKEREDETEEEEEEEDLPHVYIPDPPSPLYCGFYSQPGHFWLSMGGFDSGFLYHCKFSEEQDEDPGQGSEDPGQGSEDPGQGSEDPGQGSEDPGQGSHEPFDLLPLHDTDDDPVLSVTFSTNRRLLLCGMHSGAIRVYPLQPDDRGLSSTRAYWALGVHDNQRGHLRHIRCSHDDRFVLTAGDDGNIFSFCLLPLEELQRSLESTRAKVPSQRAGLENEALAQDIEDPAADSIEAAKRNLETSRLQREAELKLTAKRKKLAELQRTYRQLLMDNQRLSEHVRLKPEELQLDSCFQEQAESEKCRRILEVRKQLIWEDERRRVALSKIQDWSWDSLENNTVSVVSIRGDHRVSTYRLRTLGELQSQPQHVTTTGQPDGDGDAAAERRKHRGGPVDDSGHSGEEEVLQPRAPRPVGIKLGDRQEEKLRKAAEKAELVQAKIEKRKQEWARVCAQKPDENYEDPQAVQAIREARENIGDLRLRTETDRAVPEHLRMNTERKRAEIKVLEKNTRDKQTEMNGRIVALRDSKVRLVSRLNAQAEQLHEVQEGLAAHLRRPPPVLPTVRPEETPEKRLQFDNNTLERYRVLREQRLRFTQQEEEEEEGSTLLEQLEKERGRREGSPHPSLSSGKIEEDNDDDEDEDEEELSELEAELHREEEIKLLYEQEALLEQMESCVRRFDAELLLLRHQKLHLDWELKMADLRHDTLCQELLLLMEFERRESGLQEALDRLVREQSSITSRLDECDEQLQQKQRDVARLQEREKAVMAAFQASLGQNNKFESSLSRIFRKNLRRVRKRKEDEQNDDGEEDSDEDSDDDDDDDDDSGSEENSLQHCDSQLYENTLQLRQRRLDVETLLMEEKKRAEALKDERDVLVKKQKTVKISVTAAENDLDLINREKQQKMNQLDVVVPLRLHQIEFVEFDSIPSDLSEALVLDRTELNRLRGRIEQLHVEKNQQRDAKVQARRDHARLIHERKDLKVQIHELEQQCDALMMRKFGRLVDLEVLQTLTGNRELEELKQQKVLQEAQWAAEIKQWHVKVEASHDALMEVTKYNTELLSRKKNLVDQNTELKRKLDSRQKNPVAPFLDRRRRVDQEEIRRLQTLVKQQSDQADAIRREIHFLSRKGGHVVAPSQVPLPPLIPAPTGDTHTPGRPFKLTNVQKSHK